MAALFYKRYVPQSEPSAKNDNEVERPPKRRKKSKATSTDATLPVVASDIDKHKPDKHGLANGSVELENQQEKPLTQVPNGEPKSQRRKKSKHNTHPSPSPDIDTKHEKLRSKFQKAVKHATEPDPDRARPSKPEHNEDASENPPTHGLVPIPQPEQCPPDPKATLSSALPEWLREPIQVSSRDTASFWDFPIPPRTLETLHKKGYSSALPIQAALLPMLLPGPKQYRGDICIGAATGSGKTLAYALPMVEALKGKPRRLLRGLVIVPTRELVAQVRETFLLSAHGSSLNVEMAVGNRSLTEEKELLVQKGERFDPFAYANEQKKEQMANEDEELDLEYDIFNDSSTSPLLPGYVTQYYSKVDILITTPGRLVEHIHSTPGFTLQHVQWLVIDEADRLLADSFQQWVDTVVPELEALPALDEMQERVHRFMRTLRTREVRKILLSATMTKDVSKLAALRLKAPRMVVLEAAKSEAGFEQEHEAEDTGETFTLPETLTEIAVPVEDSGDKPLYLIEILEKGVQLAQQFAPKKDPNENSSQESEATSSDESSFSPSSPSTIPSPPTTHGTLIFTSSTTSCTRLTFLLQTLLPTLSAQIHNLTKHTSVARRRRALSSFTSPSPSPIPPTLPLLLTTDRSSRGLDIPLLARVINYDIPASVTGYVHRVGRTARAGHRGTAITLLERQQARWFWNQIARDPVLKRVGKVGRGKVGLEKWEGGRRREEYASALERLERAVGGRE